MDIFQVASTARQAGEETPDRLFVGEMEPQNPERPWLAIRGLALLGGTPIGTVPTGEPGLAILIERP